MFANFANSRAPPIRNHQNFEKWDVSLWDSMITGKTWEEKHVFWGFNRKNIELHWFQRNTCWMLEKQTARDDHEIENLNFGQRIHYIILNVWMVMWPSQIRLSNFWHLLTTYSDGWGLEQTNLNNLGTAGACAVLPVEPRCVTSSSICSMSPLVRNVDLTESVSPPASAFTSSSGSCMLPGCLYACGAATLSRPLAREP